MLLGPRRAAAGALVEGRLDKALVIDTLLPDTPERFPWGGHLGIEDGARGGRRDRSAIKRRSSSPTCARRPSSGISNLLKLRPDWAGVLALHHGSLARETRDFVELGLKAGYAEGGRLHLEPRSRRRFPARRAGVADRIAEGRRAAVAARRPQRPRAGPRLAHHHRAEPEPRDSSRRRRSSARSPERKIESRRSPSAPLDVLAQHCVTVALGGGFRAEALLAEVRDTVAYENSERRGLGLVPRFRPPGRPEPHRLSRFQPRRARRRGRLARRPANYVGKRHRLNIGAIVGDTVDHGAIRPGAARAEARHGRGKFHRAPAAGREILVRRPRARIRAHPRRRRLT